MCNFTRIMYSKIEHSAMNYVSLLIFEKKRLLSPKCKILRALRASPLYPLAPDSWELCPKTIGAGKLMQKVSFVNH